MRHYARTALAACASFTICGSPAIAIAPFSHIIIVFQENRTPDNLFGSNPTFEPGVDIATSGQNSKGQTVTLKATPIDGCYDVDHSHQAFTTMYNGGKMDGADRQLTTLTSDCRIPLEPAFRFADNSTGVIQPYFDIAKQYGFANRMFQSNQGPSFPAHQFIFGGTSAPTETSRLFAAENMALIGAAGGAGCAAARGQRVAVIDAQGSEASFPPVFPCFDRPTMAELLEAAGLGWRYYLDTQSVRSIWNAPAAIKNICVAQPQGKLPTCTGPDYVANVIPTQAQVLTDIGNCELAKVSWVIPDALDSDHAGVTGTTGPAWVASIVNAVGTQPLCPGGENYWKDTSILITWDDWGGWYDHVPPYHVGGWATRHWGEGYTYGFRVPLLVVSAYTPAGYIDNDPHDFGSILSFIEANYGLGRIGPGYYADAFATDLSAFFTLTAPRSFSVIPAKWDASYFLHRPPSNIGPDDD